MFMVLMVLLIFCMARIWRSSLSFNYEPRQKMKPTPVGIDFRDPALPSQHIVDSRNTAHWRRFHHWNIYVIKQLNHVQFVMCWISKCVINVLLLYTTKKFLAILFLLKFWAIFMRDIKNGGLAWISSVPSRPHYLNLTTPISGCQGFFRHFSQLS